MTLPRPIGRNERVDPKPEELGLRSQGQKAAASGTRSLVMARTMAMIGHQGEQSSLECHPGWQQPGVFAAPTIPRG